MPRTRSRVLSAARATASCFDAWPTDACGIADLLLQRVEVRADVLFHPARVLRSGALQRALGIANLLADPLVANAAGRVVELARRVLFVAAHLVGELLELLLQVRDLGVHRVLALSERLRLRVAAGAGLSLIEAVHIRRDLLLLARELLGLSLRALQVALAAAALVAFELLLRLAEPVERLVRLRAAVLRSVGRRAPHRVGRVLQLLHGVVQLLPLLLIARELLELARRFFRFVGERALRGARTAAAAPDCAIRR